MISAAVLADSLSPAGSRLTTLSLTFPRFLLPQLNTHRVFSRNTSSSRAIPSKKLLEQVRTNPATPSHWGKNQPGMQASEELPQAAKDMAASLWDSAADNAGHYTQALLELGLHKQAANRLLEPFLHCTVLLSSTNFSNFLALRLHHAAQPEMKLLAQAVSFELNNSTPAKLNDGDWHIPFLHDREELLKQGVYYTQLLDVSAGRCARVSYLTHDGRKDPQEDIELAVRLRSETPPHMSPFEHQACAMSLDAWHSKVFEKLEFARRSNTPFNPATLGNFTGFTQYRKFIANEAALD